MAKMLGPDAKIRVNNQVWASASGEYEAMADMPDSSDTEGDGFKENEGGLKELTANITAHVDDTVSPHAGAFSIQEGELIDLEIYPYGILGDPVRVDNFRIERIRGQFQVQGSQIQTFTFSGKSTGSYEKPGE